MIALIVLVVALDRVGPADVKVCRGFEIQSVGFTDVRSKAIGTCARVRGNLPLSGVWSLKVLSVSKPNGQPAPITQSMGWETDLPIQMAGTEGFSPLKPGPMPTKLRIKGELVHYRNVEETAEFPVVQLKQLGSGSDKWACRDWFVPDNDSSTAKTYKGLVLRSGKLRSFGYSGPPYNDLSRLPVEVDLATLNGGVARKLKECGVDSVARVDAYRRPDMLVNIWERTPETLLGVFGFRGKEFTPLIQLKLHVIRRIVDKRFDFSLVVPVQRDKDLYEDRRLQPNPSKALKWPSSHLA